MKPEDIKAELEYIEANTIASSDPRTTRMVDPDKIQFYVDRVLDKLRITDKVRIRARYAGKYLQPRNTEVYEFRVQTQKQTSYHDAGIDIEEYILSQHKEDFFYKLVVELIEQLMNEKIIKKGMTKIYRKLEE